MIDLRHGDCLEVMKTIPDGSVDLVVTDCPYHIVSGGCTNIPRKDEPSGIFNRNSVYCVAKGYCDNLDEFEKVRHELNKCGIEYPPMKLMDMCFWQDAYIDDLKQR